MKILIIEDEILIQKSLQLLLSQKGHSVKATNKGSEALEFILEENFDIIVTDLMLNDISGFDVIEGSLKKYKRKEISQKFIIISAYSSDQIMEKAQSYQCTFIRKPFSDINMAVEKILQKVSQDEN